MEHFLVEALATMLGGYANYSYEPELDGIIVDRKGRPTAVAEVKWGNVSKRDVANFLEKTEGFVEKYLITPKSIQADGVTVLGPSDIIKAFKK